MYAHTLQQADAHTGNTQTHTQQQQQDTLNFRVPGSISPFYYLNNNNMSDPHVFFTSSKSKKN